MAYPLETARNLIFLCKRTISYALFFASKAGLAGSLGFERSGYQKGGEMSTGVCSLNIINNIKMFAHIRYFPGVQYLQNFGLGGPEKGLNLLLQITKCKKTAIFGPLDPIEIIRDFGRVHNFLCNGCTKKCALFT